MKKTIVLPIIFLLIIGFFSPPGIAAGTDINAVLDDIARVVLNDVKNPQVGMVGGDWAVFGLARCGVEIPGGYFDTYFRNVENLVKERSGILDERKYTEYSRVILAVSAAGYDPENVGGYSLAVPLGDFNKTVAQGINGPIFALIATDAAGLDIPAAPDAAVAATKDKYVDEILKRQLPDGGFAIYASAAESEADSTAMALQALTKHRQRADVNAAVERALARLSKMKIGYGLTEADDAGVETVAQTIVALCGLGIDVDDPRFNKNGLTLTENLLKYYVRGKGFEQNAGKGVNQMATEQALYALAAIYRAGNGLPGLYDFSDAPKAGNAGADDGGSRADITPMPVIAPGKTFSDISGCLYADSIIELASRGIINGKGDARFEPYSKITRAEFAAIIIKGLGLKPGPAGNFSDVKQGDWFYGYVGAAYKYGIIYGVTKDKFNPDGFITRQEAAVMAARAAGLCGINTAVGVNEADAELKKFTDGSVTAEWARLSAAFCIKYNLLPSSGSALKPEETVTRGEIAEILRRLFNLAGLIK